MKMLNWLASTAMLRTLPTKDSAAMMVHTPAMPRLSASSAPRGDLALIHMMGGRMKVMGIKPMLEMRPLQGSAEQRETGRHRPGREGAGRWQA